MVSARRNERGENAVILMIVISIISVAIVNHVMLATLATVASAQARSQFAVRQAALERIDGTVPTTVGGSLYPATPIAGWTDVVCVGDDGSLSTTCEAGAPGRVLVRRQWRLATTAGVRTFEVSAVVLDASGGEPDMRRRASASLARRLS